MTGVHDNDARAGAQVVESYGDGRFRISGEIYTGSILVLPLATHAWPASTLDAADQQHFVPLVEAAAGVELLLLGCGPRGALTPAFLHQLGRDNGIAIEPMDTGAAARTFNLLASEGRQVAAALIAVD